MESKTPSKVYVVFGYARSGSGGLTFPEDFDIGPVYFTPEAAQEEADRLNKEAYEESVGDEDDDGLTFESFLEETTDYILYDVIELDVKR